MDLLLDWQHYYRLNVILLSSIGLWPYENKLILRLKRFIGSFLVCLTCVCQLATFYTVTYTRRLMLRNIPIIFVGCGVLQKYTLFIAASDFIRTLTEDINGDWRELSSREEIQIVEKYIERGKLHTKGFAVFICPAAISLLLAPLSSTFLDIVMPLNEPRNRSFPVMFVSLFDPKKHFFLVALIFDACIALGAIIFVSTESLLIVYVQHACALFEVTSYRIKTLLCATGTTGSKSSSNVVATGQVVEIHSKALRFCKSVKEYFLLPYLLLVVFGILSLGLHLFHCTQTFTKHEFSEFLTSATLCVATFGYIFYVNYMMQNVLDISANLFDAFYDTNWYAFPSSSRKLVLFCMLNSTKPIGIDVYGIFYPSYEGFSLIVRMTMSYVTALYSFQ